MKKYTDTIQVIDAQVTLRKSYTSIVNLANSEKRELTDEETKQLEEIKNQIAELEIQKQELEAKLNEETVEENEGETPDDETPEDEPEKEEKEERYNMKNFVKEIRNAKNGDVFELRDLSVSVANKGGNGVSTEATIYDAIRENLMLDKMGATVMNVTDNQVLSVYGGSNAVWASENGTVNGTDGTFSKVTLDATKRLCVIVPVSNAALHQLGIEEMLKKDIVNAIASKLQSTIFSADAAVEGVSPKGLFNGVTAKTTDGVTYNELINLEEQLAKYPNKVYVMGGTASALTRTTQKGDGVGFIQQNGEIDGVPVFKSGDVLAKGIIAMDPSELVVAIFSEGANVVVDNLTGASNNLTKLIINLPVDYAVRRPEAVKTIVLK